MPQKRERVFIVGIRNDLEAVPTFPQPTGEIVPLKSVLMKDEEVDKQYFFSKKAVDGMRKANSKMNKGRAQNINNPCSTVTSHLAKVSLNSTDPVLKIRSKFRRFTPREVARIQSFPNNFRLVGPEGKQYKALGNAIPPVLMWHVSRSVLNLLSEKQIAARVE